MMDALSRRGPAPKRGSRRHGTMSYCTPYRSSPLIDIPAVTHAIDDELPETARAVIRKHLDLSVAANNDFLAQPDAREHHQTQWHQWGIITHTRVFLEDFRVVVPGYLREWGLWSQIDECFRATIDGATKWALLDIVVLLHDIGKFAARTRGRERFHFARHERLSRQIILDELGLERYGLTPAQIEYIARCAGDHFVLGVVRKRARERGSYNEIFIESDDFVRLACQIKREHPEDFIEIGVLFLGDSLAKLNPPEGPSVALTQYDLNIAVAHRYLTLVLAPAPDSERPDDLD